MDDRRLNLHSSILEVASLIKNKDQIKAKQLRALEKKKRDRTANYSKAETERLVDLALAKKHILECKQKNNLEAWDEKRAVWEDITREFNKKPRAGETYRDTKTLRLKYETLKSTVKKKWLSVIEQRNPKGKMPKFSAAEKKIKDLIMPSLPIKGFCDFQSMSDNKSDSDDYSRESNISESNIEDVELYVKKENSDEECSINFEEPDKLIRQDPLVGNQLNTSTVYNEPVPKRSSGNDCSEIQNIQGNLNDNEAATIKTKLQIDMLKEELEIKKLQRKMLEQELEQKQTMHELEKEHLLLKIKALKKTVE